jgi:hypothetical protein
MDSNVVVSTLGNTKRCRGSSRRLFEKVRLSIGLATGSRGVSWEAK